MYVHVNYGFVSGAVFVFSDCKPENEKEKAFHSEYNKAVEGMIKGKVKTDTDNDESNLLHSNFNSMTKLQIETIILRVIKTVSLDFGCKFKALLKHVVE